MGRYQLRFVICTLCIILQCDMSIQNNNDYNTFKIRIPINSISNKNSVPQNRQYGSFPYPYYTQLSQYYANLCNSCKSFLCNNQCRYSNPLKLNSPSNTLSVPLNSNSGRISLVIDTRCPPKPTPDAANPAPNNGENNVDVIVKVVPIDSNSTNETAYTSAQSSAEHDKDDNEITALTTAQELDSQVTDVNTETPLETSLQSQIITENEDGDVLVPNFEKTAILEADTDDTTVTGDTPPSNEPAPDTPATPPADEQQAPPVTPESDTPPAAAPPADSPPPASPPVPAPPADTPPPASPPAPAPSADAPPAPTPAADSPPPDSPPAPAPTSSVTSQTTATAVSN